MLTPDISKITTDKLHLFFLESKKVQMDMLRLDKIHPVISGNKWFKLKYHLENFRKGGFNGLLTFGGVWSNHIVATACASFHKKIPSVGIIRGERPSVLSPSLKQAMNFEMKLDFIPRELYKQKDSDDFIKNLKNKYPGFYMIPEGGAGEEGEKGAGEIMNLINKDVYTHIACAIGTATMFKGIAKTVSANQQVLGVVVLKGWKKINKEHGVTIFDDYHFGGYARYTPQLIESMNDFYKQTRIPTDFVYTGKLVYAVMDLINKNFFPENSKILLIHSGGLQGNTSLPDGSLIF